MIAARRQALVKESTAEGHTLDAIAALVRIVLAKEFPPESESAT